MCCGIDNDDAYNSRPIYGMTQINFKNYKTGADNLQTNLYTLLHEITHALGFSSSLYQYYINPSTGAYLKSSSFVTTTSPYKLTLPKILKIAQDHYNCSTLQGVMLEDNGATL